MEDEINKIRDEIPDNSSLLKKIKKTKYSSILEYVLFQLQRATINFTKNNKIKENDTRNEVVSELDAALNEEANGIDNHELIQELQNSLNAIDIEKEQDYLKNKTSWDILEREKPKKQFIKLESLREGYHDPTLLKIHKKVIDTDLPAPHEKTVYSHLSSDQKEITGEIKRTFQKINAKQAFLTTEKNDIINFLTEGNDTEPMNEIERRKISIKPHEWEKCNKKYFDDEELHEALFKHMKGSSSPGPDGFTVNWLRQFWPEMKDLTREALNSSTTGLTKTLRLAIIKILRKGSKDPKASNYQNT